MRLFCITFLTLCVVISVVNSYRILGIFPHPAKSHYIVGDALMKGLAAKGHEVTMISPHRQTKSIRNYRRIHLEHTLLDAARGVEAGNFVNYNGLYFVNLVDKLYQVSINLTQSILKSENFYRFLHEREHFDVVIFEIFGCDAMIGLGHHFNAPTIGFSTIGPTKWTSDLIGLSDFSSHIPIIYNGYSDRMTFWQRMYNSLNYWYEDIQMISKYFPAQQKLLEQIFPNGTEMPTIEELKRNVSLVFVNSHVSYGIPQHSMPNLIEIGGVHVNQDFESLADDVQEFMDNAVNGTIYFSLGSNVKLSKLPAEQKKIIANAFSEIPNVRILIKNEENFVIPSHDSWNVLVRPWFNQEAILSHPNLKVFITHGGSFHPVFSSKTFLFLIIFSNDSFKNMWPGLLSTTEAVYFGKPMVGIPVFFDQTVNMKIAHEKGYGINVPYEFLTEIKLKSAIRQVLTNSRFLCQEITYTLNCIYINYRVN